LFSVSGQVVVIVGASSGVGRATAVLFAREGAKVVAAARRENRLQSLKDELAREKCDITVRRADASDQRICSGWHKRPSKSLAEIDILVFASGTNTPDRAMARLSPELGTRA